MKGIFLVYGLVMCVGNSKGQFLGGFFSQKKTELQYYLQQIAALKLYALYLEKGYRIAQKGLTAITEIKNGEFDVHRLFFNSLSNVNPAIDRYAKISEVTGYQLTVLRDYRKSLKIFGESKLFSGQELAYLQEVYDELSEESSKNLAELSGVLTKGEFELSDDQRIRRVEAICSDIKDRWVFVHSFLIEARGLSAERARDLNTTDFLKKLN